MRPWRKLCPPAVRKSQQSALQTSSLFLVREAGPAAFIIEEESMREVTRVTLGDTHTCTCKQFKASKELCIHICWVLLKKLRLRTVDPLSFQVGLDQRELDNCLRGVHEWRPGVVGAGASITETRGPGQPKPVRKRLVGDNDICPICLEEFSARRSPIVFCKYSCGNGLHAKCMTVLAERQTSGSDLPAWKYNPMLRCPICRGDFGTKRELRDAASKSAASLSSQQPLTLFVHPMASCKFCLKGPPLYGNLYKCLACPQVVVCVVCMKSNNFQKLHSNHKIAVKKSPSSNWTPMTSPIAAPAPSPYLLMKDMPKPPQNKVPASAVQSKDARVNPVPNCDEIRQLLRVDAILGTMNEGTYLHDAL